MRDRVDAVRLYRERDDNRHSLIWPHQVKLVEAIHSFGGYARLHICGQTQHLWPGIARLGVDVFDVDHMVDLKEARKALGPKVSLAGNINPAAAVRFGEPEAIRHHVRRNYAEAEAPYMVCAGCEIPAGTPQENLAALCEPVCP
jgi:uroporphyrinogen-III decarboxylase